MSVVILDNDEGKVRFSGSEDDAVKYAKGRIEIQFKEEETTARPDDEFVYTREMILEEFLENHEITATSISKKIAFIIRLCNEIKN